MSYLERYLEGQYQQVWDDLRALGQDVFVRPVYVDALAVVQEAMRRIRRNLELLIPRLLEIGFVFGYDHLIRETLRLGSRDVDWMEYVRILQWSHQQPPVFLSAKPSDQSRAELQAFRVDGTETYAGEDGTVLPDMSACVQELDRLIGPLPLVLRVWYEQVGAINLYGYHPTWMPPSLQDLRDRYLMDYCDPLQIAVLDDAHTRRLIELHQQRGLTQFEFAADRHFKNFTGGSSTPYALSLVNAGIDGPLSGVSGTSFIQYLRMSFKWGGFPGMAEWPAIPTEDLAFLTNGLLPF